jgi:magnesium transporter
VRVTAVTSTWIDLLDPDRAKLAAVMPDEVHATAINQFLAPTQNDDEPRPRLETHGNHVFGVLVVPVVENGVENVLMQEIDVLVTPQALFTIRKTPEDGPPFMCDDVRAASLRDGNSPGMNLYMVFDEIAERYLDVVDQLDNDIDRLEDDVETTQAPILRARISAIRHDILNIRRVLAPTRDAARAVLDDRVEIEGHELFPRDVEIRFADAYDKLLRATDNLDLARDLLAGVRDYHQAQVANDQNEVMKRLTVVASLLLPPTFIVGLYGMNLRDIPELRWRHGYAFVWALIIVSTVAQVLYFRRKKWI